MSLRHSGTPGIDDRPAGRRDGSGACLGRTLVLFGVNHTTAPVEVRERLAISNARLARCVVRSSRSRA